MDQKKLDELAKYSKPADSMELSRNIRLGLYGDHGKWKTVTACRVGQLYGRVLLLPYSNDWESLLNHPEVIKDVQVEDQVDPVQLWLISQALKEKAPGYDNYGAVVIDTASEWVNFFVDDLTQKTTISARNGRGKYVPRPGAGGERFIRDFDLALTEQSDYNTARNRLRPIVRNLMKANIAVIYTAHARLATKDTDKLAQNDFLRPDMPEQCYNVIARNCNAMGQMYMSDEPGKGVIVDFRSMSNMASKSRLDYLTGKLLTTDSLVQRIDKWIKG